MKPEWTNEIERIHAQAIKHSRPKIEPWSDADIRFLTLALAGEVGELANRIKKHWRGDVLPDLDHDPNIREELADIRVYLHLAATACGVDLDEAIEEKLPQIRVKFPASMSAKATGEASPERER